MTRRSESDGEQAQVVIVRTGSRVLRQGLAVQQSFRRLLSQDHRANLSAPRPKPADGPRRAEAGLRST